MMKDSKNSQFDAAQSVSLLGCGWLGIALAPSLQERGLSVRGSTTRSAKLATLSSMGIEPHLLRIETTDAVSGEAPTAVNTFFDSQTLLINLPPETAFGPDYHLGQLREILSQIASSTRHLMYVSSTSVYGTDQGDVTEDTTPKPSAGSGEILVASEKLLEDFARVKGLSLTIVRAAGLIGPGRHPGLFLAGRKNVRDGESAVNLIHQADVVQILTVLMTSHAPKQGEIRIYNAVAPAHPSRREFYAKVSNALGVEAPEFAANKTSADDASTSASTPGSTKLVRGDKIVEETGLKFIYGDLYSGLGIKT